MKRWLLLLALATGLCAATKTNRPAIKIAYSDTAIEIHNVATKNWSECVIYINGDPPAAFRATIAAPKIGQKAQVKLASFVDKSGQRFNPTTMAVVKIWVGGGGYDFERHNVRR